MAGLGFTPKAWINIVDAYIVVKNISVFKNTFFYFLHNHLFSPSHPVIYTFSYTLMHYFVNEKHLLQKGFAQQGLQPELIYEDNQPRHSQHNQSDP